MGRRLPQGLSDTERLALTEFFAGHITAGQFAEMISGRRVDGHGISPAPNPVGIPAATATTTTTSAVVTSGDGEASTAGPS